MNDAEMFAFMDTFRNLTQVFPWRGDEHELRQVGAAYFKAFRRKSLTDIQSAADIWTQQGKRFPKPAEWLEAIPRQSREAELLPATDVEWRDYRAAEVLGWESKPCPCPECRAAGVEDKPLRFVPVLDAEDRTVQRMDTQKGRPFTIGQWIHGAALARWYKARADFYNTALEHKLRGDVLKPKARARKPSDLEPMS